MSKLIKLVIGSILLLGVILGVIWLIEAIVEWTCVDMGRTTLFMLIMIYTIYKLIKEEFDKQSNFLLIYTRLYVN